MKYFFGSIQTCLAALFTPGLACHRLQAPCIRTINRASRPGLEGTVTHAWSLVTQLPRPALRNAQQTSCSNHNLQDHMQSYRGALGIENSILGNTDAIQADEQLVHTQGRMEPSEAVCLSGSGPYTHTSRRSYHGNKFGMCHVTLHRPRGLPKTKTLSRPFRSSHMLVQNIPITNEKNDLEGF